MKKNEYYYLQIKADEVKSIRNTLCLIYLLITNGDQAITMIKLFNMFDDMNKKVNGDSLF